MFNYCTATAAAFAPLMLNLPESSSKPAMFVWLLLSYIDVSLAKVSKEIFMGWKAMLNPNFLLVPEIVVLRSKVPLSFFEWHVDAFGKSMEVTSGIFDALVLDAFLFLALASEPNE